MSQERAVRLSMLVEVLLAAVLATSDCADARSFAPVRSEPVVVDRELFTGRKVVELRTGDELSITGYTPDVIAVGDGDILQLVNDAPDTRGGNATSPSENATYVAVRPGQTEVVVTHSMCEGITGCGGPALYYRLQVHVR